MTISTAQPAPAGIDQFAPWQAALGVWLALGAAALLFVPDLRGTDPWFGWLPFWLVVAPAIDLAVLRRRQGLAWLRAGVCALREHRHAHRRQASPLRARRARSALGAWTSPAASRPPLQSVMPRRLRSMRRRNSPMMRR